MARKHYRIGVMFSTTGSYSVVARSMLNGALLAFQENAEAGRAVALEPVVVNPSGDLARYRALSLELLGAGIRRSSVAIRPRAARKSFPASRSMTGCSVSLAL